MTDVLTNSGKPKVPAEGTADQLLDSQNAIALLHEASPVRRLGLVRQRLDEEELSQALDYNFVVFPTTRKTTELRPPIDWVQDPFESRSWRAQLHALNFLHPLLVAHDTRRNTDALRIAARVALDWVACNRRGAPGISEYAWADKLVGDRAPVFGYLLRAASHERSLTPSEEADLLESALEHGRFLRNDANYVRSTNHGLFQDAGLLFLSHYLEFLPEAADWRHHAVDRFARMISRFVTPGEGLYLEHSPAYQWVIASLINRLEGIKALDELLAEVGSPLRDAAGWLVMPDGLTPPIGDSDLTPAPPWTRRYAAKARGLKVFRKSGMAVVKTEESMLILSAGYHSHAHKHADELGFCLFEAGELVLAEAGKYGYDSEDVARRYALSSSAHNVLQVDDSEFSWRGIEPYGSAISRAGRSGDWYAIEGCNPLLERQNVDHRRLFLYKPGKVLVVVDRVRSTEARKYTRLFHFGPNVSAELNDDRVRFEVGSVSGTLRELSDVETSLSLSKAQKDPTMAGWMFPRYRLWTPVSTVGFSSSATEAVLVAAFSLTDDTIVSDARVDGDAASVSFEGGEQGTLAATPRGDHLVELSFRDTSAGVMAGQVGPLSARQESGCGPGGP